MAAPYFQNTGRPFGGDADTRRDQAQSPIRMDVNPAEGVHLDRMAAWVQIKRTYGESDAISRGIAGTVKASSYVTLNGEILIRDLSIQGSLSLVSGEQPKVFAAFDGLVFDISKVDGSNLGLVDYKAGLNVFSVDAGMTVYGLLVTGGKQALKSDEKRAVLNEALMLFYEEFLLYTGIQYGSSYDATKPMSGVEAQFGGTITVANTSRGMVELQDELMIQYPLFDEIVNAPTAEEPFGVGEYTPGTALNLGSSVPTGSSRARIMPVEYNTDEECYQVRGVGKKKGFIKKSWLFAKGGMAASFNEVAENQRYDPRRFGTRKPFAKALRAANAISNLEIQFVNET
jgi:hypothetical protein